MNFYFSSSSGSEENTKSKFENEFLPIQIENQNIVLKSIKIHNVISLINESNIPHFKSTSKNHKFLDRSIWKKESGDQYDIEGFTLSFFTYSPPRRMSKEINFERKTYKTIKKFISDLNELFKKNNIWIYFEIKNKIVSLTSKYFNAKIKCSDKKFFKNIGFSRKETLEMNILKQKFVGKNKVNFKKSWVKLFYLNFNEITSIEDLSCAYNNLIKTLNGENNSSEEIFSVKGNQLVILPIEDVVDYFPSDHITGTIAIPRKNNDIQFNLKILSQICKIKKII